jgi:hypothetical protein
MLSTLGGRPGRFQSAGCDTRAAAGRDGGVGMTQDSHPSLPTGRERRERRLRTRRRLGDGSATHHKRSGEGPREGCLASTSRGNGGWVRRELQMPEDLPDHLALRDGRDNPQRPLRAKRTRSHIESKHPLQQPRPVPLEMENAGVMRIALLMVIMITCAGRSLAGRARRALRLERLSWTCSPAGTPWFTSCRKLRHERPSRADHRPWETPRPRRSVG